MLGERFRRGKLQRARAGQVRSHAPPYGYRYMPRREHVPGHLVIEEGEAAIVQLVYGWVADECVTVRQVLKRRNEGPWRPRSGKDYWSTSVLQHMVADPVYVGTAYVNRSADVVAAKPRRPDSPRAGTATVRQLRPREEWIAIPVPAIVDQELFDRVQAQLARNSVLSCRNNTRHTYLLRCLLTCGRCGLAMCGVTYRSPSDKVARRYYRCAGKDPVLRGRGRICPRRPGTCDLADAAVWDHLVALRNEPERLLDQFQQQAPLAAQGDAHERAEAQRLTARLERLGREDRRLVDAYQAGILSLAELAENGGKRWRSAGRRWQRSASNRAGFAGSRPTPKPCWPTSRPSVRACARA